MEDVHSIFEGLIGWLPDSPFQAIVQNSQVQEIIGMINWFLPITEMLAIMQSWLTCVLAYYLYSAILRTVNLIK